MKRLFTIPLLALFALSGAAQTGKIHCHIEGRLEQKPDCDKLMLLPVGKLPNFVKSDKMIEVKDGKFSYDLYADEADVYNVIPYDEYLRGQWYAARIFVENGTVNITFTGSGDVAPVIRTEGLLNCEFQRIKKEADSLYLDRIWAEMERLEKEERDYTPEIIALHKAYEATRDEAKRDSIRKEAARLDEEGRYYTPEYTALEKQAEAGRAKARLHHIAYARRLPSLVGLYLLLDVKNGYKIESELADSLLSVFRDVYDARYPEHRMANDLRCWTASRNIKVGGKYNDFIAPDINGTEHRLSEEIKGKYALIDLWASWCGPCRHTSKSMIPVYEAYKDKGFTIVGVARETDVQNMARAVEKDKYPWLNLVELNDKAHIWEYYGINYAAGGTYLVAPDGTILALSPTAEQVQAILAEHLK